MTEAGSRRKEQTKEQRTLSYEPRNKEHCYMNKAIIASYHFRVKGHYCIISFSGKGPWLTVLKLKPECLMLSYFLC